MSKTRIISFGQQKETPLDRLIASIRLGNILRHIPPQAVMVDLGCGYHGKLLALVSSRIKRGIGFDLSVSKSSSRAKNIHLESSRADEPLPLKSSSVDAITALAVIEHVERPGILLKESFRVLKPGGILLLTTPALHAKPLLEFMAFKLHVISAEEIGDHKQYYTKKSLRKAIIKAGFPKNKLEITTFELGFNIFAKAKK